MPDDWERANGLNVGQNDANGEADGDGARNGDEYAAGTLAGAAHSRLDIVGVTPRADGTLDVTWRAVAGKLYRLCRSGDFAAWVPVEGSTRLATATGEASAAVRMAGTNGTCFRVMIVPEP